MVRRRELFADEVVWQSYNLNDRFAHEDTWPWLANPQEWLGLHKIISYIFKNVGWSAVIIVVGILVRNYGAENTNGLLRQYFPKGTDFNTISDDAITLVENELNNRPRKCLNYKRPIEILKQNKKVKSCVN